MSSRSPDFGNWIRLRIVAAFVLTGAILIGAGAFLATGVPGVLLEAVGLSALAMAAFLGYLYYQFSDGGGGLQQTLWRTTLDALDWQGSGSVLDVGTGNGALAILLALRYPDARVTGVDPWGPGWEYSREHCLENAARCGVASRARFVPASAVALPFGDGVFDAVVSHFVFHEVSETQDKLDVLEEALRVLRSGGAFAFHDMFFDRKHYPDAAELLHRLRGLGLAEVELIRSDSRTHVPRIMRARRVLGARGIVRGRK